MPRVLIACPVTHKPLPTGLELDAVAFQLKRGARFAPCPQGATWARGFPGGSGRVHGWIHRSWFLDQGPIE
jgi:hypothetical protein